MKGLTAVACVLSVCPLLAAEVEVDTSSIKVGVRRVFPEVQIKRPIVVTHANDGSDRIFVASQL